MSRSILKLLPFFFVLHLEDAIKISGLNNQNPQDEHIAHGFLDQSS